MFLNNNIVQDFNGINILLYGGLSGNIFMHIPIKQQKFI